MPTISQRAFRLFALLGAALPALLCGGCTYAYHFGTNKDGSVGGSTFTKHVDWLYMFIFWLSVFCLVGITATMIYFVVKYRRRPGGPMVGENFHNDWLEIVWSVIPSIICVFIFYWGFVGFLDMKQAPKDAYEIQVTAQQWSWSFTHPNGLITDMGQGLHVPSDRPVRLTMNSVDVTHGFYIPAFRTKMDVLPGRFTKLWFDAKQGTYGLQCSEYCGKGHSQMDAEIHVLPPGEFEKTLEKLDIADDKLTAAQRGQKLYEGRGCKGCHSLDGTPGIGPSWKGLYGNRREFVDGSILEAADENYLRESMLQPMAKVVKGYSPSMPSFAGKLKEKKENNQVADLIAFIKSLPK